MINLTDVWGKPRVYKNISIHPVRMRDIESFYEYVQCLLIPKSSIHDAQIIKMSYLSFILMVSSMEGNQILLEKLIGLLKLILKTENIQFEFKENGRVYIIVDDENKLNERDFDKIKTIISEQNLIDLDDEYVNPEVKKAIDDARAFMAKKGNKSASLDQQIIAYHCKVGLEYDKIADLTIYQFNKGLARFDLISSAEAILAARYSGMVEFKDESKIPHWLGHIDDRGKNEDVIIAASDFEKKTNELGLTKK